MATDDLKARMADVATFGYMPAAARLALQQGVKRIATLEAQLAAVTEERDLWKQSEATCDALYTKLAGELAARDAEIAAWLRAQYNGRLQSPVYMADAIERGDYAKGQTDAQQGD